ncbi:MAG: hypothetical protein ABIJ09_01100 [Pseudomonadota bacterium]
MTAIDNRSNVRRPVVDSTTTNTPVTTTNVNAPVDNNSTTPPGGLDAATTNGVVPDVTGALGDGTGVSNALSHLAARTFDAPRPQDLFGLVPGRYPEAVDLNHVLTAVASQPGSQQAVQQIIDQLQRETGIQFPPAMVQAALADPQKLANMLQVTTQQMADGFDAMQASARARSASGGAQPDAPKHLLPQSFDWAKLDSVAYTRGDPGMKELAPGLYQGGLISDLPDDQAKQRVVLAEVFNRLADNANLPAGERFSVAYKGGEFTRLDTFLKALKDDGHEVNVAIKHRAANFASLMTRTPDGALHDVPAGVMMRTGVKDAQGNEAVLPALHSDLLISIKSGPTTQGPGIDADMKWYQGVPDTGFFPDGLNQTPDWLGGKVVDQFSGDEALRAVNLAGLMGDLINDSARAQGMKMSGYGVTGVCNDSVSIIQHAMGREVSAYGLFMRDSSLMDEIETRLSDRSRRNDPDYRALKKSIDAVPNDIGNEPTSRARALASMPWEPGQEPMNSAVKAREILD